MTYPPSTDWGELELLSLFRGPFLFWSIAVHGLLLVALRFTVLTALSKPPLEPPITVQLLEPRDGGSINKSIGPGSGPGGPRTMPRLGTPVAPRLQTGKLDRGSTESSVPAADAVEAAPPPKPVPLPGPKTLASNVRGAVNADETSPDSLVRLPTKESATRLPTDAAAEYALNQRALEGLKRDGQGAGIKALKEGAQLPGALRGSGKGSGPYGVPGGSPTGTGLTGGGTGSGSGGGSATGLKGLPSADYERYLNQLKKRVQAVWKYPEGVSGVQKVAILFTLDRAGRLVHSEVLESSDARLNASAVEAMKRASPFPPIPENLKDLANSPLRMQFTVTIGVRG